MSDENIKSETKIMGKFSNGATWTVRTGVDWASLTREQKKEMRAALRKSRRFKSQQELEEFLRNEDRQS